MKDGHDASGIGSLAAEFIGSAGQYSRDAADIVYEAGLIVENDSEKGWQLTRCAFELATTDAQLEFIGAALLEPLIQKFPERTVERSVELMRQSPRFLSVVRVANLTGLPRPMWERINHALAEAGASRHDLVDWSTIRPVTSDEEES